jgi:UDP-N-acetylglucosamine--N-acetylmuramyl-(pentapeptide) pyrophosphoryl-undecaprenol N-acetylglucosamine transferase
MAAGGTGGHVYPAIAIADALSSIVDSLDVIFVGTKNRMEWAAVPKAGYPIRSLWISGISRTQWWKNLWVPLKIVVSLWQSFWLCIRTKPDAVVACGGFVSGPMGKMAGWLGIPLYIQEQNTHPGVTTRLLARQAKHLFLTFEDLDGHFKGLPQTVTGNPIRQSLLESITHQESGTGLSEPSGLSELSGLSKSSGSESHVQKPSKPTVLLLGGSGGAGSLNQKIGSMLPTLGFKPKPGVADGHDDVPPSFSEAPFSFVWQCGKTYIDGVERMLMGLNITGHPDIHVTPFIEDMTSAYRDATVVISRAGAGTLTELMLQSKAAILIPSPVVAGDHQRKNGQRLVDKGAALMVEESTMENTLPTLLSELLANQEKRTKLATSLHAMANPEAAHDIARHILKDTKASAPKSNTSKGMRESAQEVDA